jgi:hypothetical protein
VRGDVLEVGNAVGIARDAAAIVRDLEMVLATFPPRVIVTERAPASMLFSTNSATAFSGLSCESAMIVIAFQSSPMRSLPRAVGRTAFSR